MCTQPTVYLRHTATKPALQQPIKVNPCGFHSLINCKALSTAHVAPHVCASNAQKQARRWVGLKSCIHCHSMICTSFTGRSTQQITAARQQHTQTHTCEHPRLVGTCYTHILWDVKTGVIHPATILAFDRLHAAQLPAHSWVLHNMAAALATCAHQIGHCGACQVQTTCPISASQLAASKHHLTTPPAICTTTSAGCTPSSPEQPQEAASAPRTNSRGRSVTAARPLAAGRNALPADVAGCCRCGLWMWLCATQRTDSADASRCCVLCVHHPPWM
jgi:hypothetical protein